MIPLPGFFIALWLVFSCTVVPSFLMSDAISPVGPVITALLATLILGEDFTAYHFVGMFMVIVAIMWPGVKG